ncbi:MAG: hypothetical protein ACN6NI_00600 [Acinetobacter sp.]
MIQKILEIGRATLGWILLISTVFFIVIYFSFDNYEKALSFTLPLFIGLLTVSCTLGAVWVAIYTLSDIHPKLHFQCVGMESKDNSLIKKREHKIRIRIDNLGGKAIKFRTNLEHQGVLRHNRYSISPQFGFEVINSIDESNKEYFMDVTINGHPDDKLEKLIEYLKFKLTFSYSDKMHNNYNEIYLIEIKKNIIDLIKKD